MKPARLLAALAVLLAPAHVWGQASPTPYTSAQRYDAMGRVTGTIAPDPDGAEALHHAAVRNGYDGAGRLIRVETGYLATWQSDGVAPADWPDFTILHTLETAYDAMGRKVRDTHRGGAAGAPRTLTQYSYDALGRLECTAVRMNPAAFAALPASACTPGAQGSDGPDRIARNVYDAAGQRLQLREGVGTPDEGTEATWAYNLSGQVSTVIDGNGNRAELRYDGHGRQDRWTFPSNARASAFDDSTPAAALASAGAVNAADYEQYGYDVAGNRISLRKRDGSTLTYAYDAMDRLTAKTVPASATGGAGYSVHYGYDLRGLQLFARFGSPSGSGVTSTYDGFGRLTSSSSNMGGAARTINYVNDRHGNQLNISTSFGLSTTYAYDGLDRPVTLADGGGVFFHFVYDEAGRLARRNPAYAVSTFGYDAIGRPASLAHDLSGTPADLDVSFASNPASQIASETRSNDLYAWTGHYAASRSYTANGLNQYVATASTTAAGQSSAALSYDANGNLVSDGANAYVYDAENRLVSVSGAHNATLAYDPLGRLWEVAGGAGVTRFVYDRDALISETNGAGSQLEAYVHGPDGAADDPLVWFDGANGLARRLLLADRQGSIVAIADYFANVTAINRYDEYGIPASTNQGRFQYTGQIWLPEIGMYHYKARVYSPTLGRFLQVDPIGYDDQFNLYEYVGDDPVNRSDPSGESWGDVAHAALNVASFCPSVCGAAASAVDGGLYAVEGDYGNAAIALGSAAVGLISDAGAARLAATGVREGVAFVRSERAAARAQARAGWYGRSQRTRSRGEWTGHGMRSAREARAMHAGSRYVGVHRNQTISTITGGQVNSRLRPDVAGLRPDGKVDIVEVLSPGQTEASQRRLYGDALGDRLGSFRVVTPSRR